MSKAVEVHRVEQSTQRAQPACNEYETMGCAFCPAVTCISMTAMSAAHIERHRVWQLPRINSPELRSPSKSATNQLIRREQPKREDREVCELWKVKYRGMGSAIAYHNSAIDLTHATKKWR
eukprot:COSAG02_NODE_208_length_29027_cov_27.870230_25_plen_121_part_00